MSEEITTESNSASTQSVPGWFWVISGIALVWNLLGVMAFFMHLAITPEVLAQMPEAERALYENSPSWMVIVFAVAVFGGTLGCIALLMKKAWAFPLLVASLAGVIIQNGYSFLMTNAVEVMGSQAIIMPAIVIIIAIGLVWFANRMKCKNILS